MARSPFAGKPAPESLLMDVEAANRAYYAKPGDTAIVSFGTSGHRGTSFKGTFTESHVMAIAQAVCDYRKYARIAGPLFLGKDTHALSNLAQESVISVLTANGVQTVIQNDGGYTPTPSISRAILAHNREVRDSHQFGDGIVLTPSHNPPEDGGCKYNPPHGGPAETAVTSWIQNRANQLLHKEPNQIRYLPLSSAMNHPCLHSKDLISPYIDALSTVIDMAAIARSGIRIAVDPLGGSSLAYWDRIASRWGIGLEILNRAIDPTFRFMAVDHDGKIRMDCSSADAMAPLVTSCAGYDLACANDPDADRHGIVAGASGLMDPNGFLAVAIDYLFTHRPKWSPHARIGKTVVSSSLIDRVAAARGISIYEVPVGFKWFVQGLFDGSLGFAGEESAGASFLCLDGTPWSTDKDGIILGLLGAEIRAVTGHGPDQLLTELRTTHGHLWYKRIDQPCEPEARRWFSQLTEQSIRDKSVGGAPAIRVLLKAPGNGESIGGFKVESAKGWFAARPSGTEDIYKIYAESFESDVHLHQIIDDAHQWVGK
jgi:phosphoglucomutase